MREALKFVLAIAIAVALSNPPRIHAQSPPVSILTAPTGSTLTNCGTPTVPGLCIVSTGVYVQQATGGWVLIPTTSGVAGVTSISINGSAAKTGVVSFTVSAAAPTATTSVTVPVITAQ